MKKEDQFVGNTLEQQHRVAEASLNYADRFAKPQPQPTPPPDPRPNGGK